MSEVRRILDQLDRAFSADAWHGPPIKSLLDGVTAEQASQRPIPHAHSIWEIVHHVTAWNAIVQHRLLGEEIKNVSQERDWPPVWEATEVAWKRSLQDLTDSYTRLPAAVENVRDDQLNGKVAGHDYSLYVMLHGDIQHILYHAGQIALLKKALR